MRFIQKTFKCAITGVRALRGDCRCRNKCIRDEPELVRAHKYKHTNLDKHVERWGIENTMNPRLHLHN